jgi:hypothetical protein
VIAALSALCAVASVASLFAGQSGPAIVFGISAGALAVAHHMKERQS